MSREATIPFSRLVIYHGEIGIHRGRRTGLGRMFGFASLRGVPFIRLAAEIKDAYKDKHAPRHRDWPDQKEALRWFIEKGVDGIYAQNATPARVIPSPYQNYFLVDGNHRALALYILGQHDIRAKIDHG